MIGSPRIKAIDGLRGLSILLVILCHLDVPWFRGGYVGVDVFFVISGYVITDSLFDRLGNANLITHFYERRSRRLLPSLFFTLLACYGAFWVIFDRADFVRLLGVGGLAAVGASNFFFSRTTSYFDDAALENPLLHTWSLAVEEQFYILLALFLFLVRFGGRRDTTLIRQRLFQFMAVGTVLSLAACLHFSHTSARFAYFQLPSRFWEIGSGSLLFFVRQKTWIPRHVAGSLLGLGLILGSAFLFDENTHYPGHLAILPVLGAQLIIASSRDENFISNKLLGGSVMVFLGAISYALYLVHWPIAVFAQSYFVRDLSVTQKIAVAALSLALATTLTYAWERPIGKGRWLGTRLGLGLFSVSGVALFLVVGAFSLTQREADLTQLGQELPMISKEQYQHTVPSYEPNAASFLDPSQVPALGPDPNNVTAVWGDSHALNLLPGLVTPGARLGLTYRFYICWATMPLMDVGGSKEIEAHNKQVLNIIVHDPRVKNVILHANWTGYLEGLRYFGHRQGRRPRFAVHGVTVTRGDAYMKFESELRETLTKLSSAGKRVFICTPTPTYPFDVSKGVAEMERSGRDPNLELSYGINDYLAINHKILSIFDRLAKSIPSTYVIPIHSTFFVDGRSIVVTNGRPLYADGHHLSAEGSAQVGDRISSLIQGKKN